MSEVEKVWLLPPWGGGEPKQFEATRDVLVPAMLAGWRQCEPPALKEEVKENVND